ncbi:MAG TPA: hypothetical protein ENJ31_08790, partial [Anaerolineae bacterium]|nr:hypothetical protein [Anaerolineae bacterium]
MDRVVDWVRRLISPEYLVVGEPGPLGGLWVLYAALGLLFAAGLGAALWVLWGPDRARAGSQSGAAAQPKDTRSTVAWAWFELWVCLAGLGTVIGRFLGWPGWSARIWPYSLAALAIAGALAYRFRRVQLPPWLIAQFRVLALRPAPVESPTRRGWLALGAAVHLAGVGLIVTGRFGWPLWTALPALLVLLLPQVPLGFRRISVRRRAGPLLMALTPLWGAYAATLLWLLYHAWGITVIGWQGLAFPNPMTSLFYVDGVLLAAVAYTWLCQVSVAAAHARARRWASFKLAQHSTWRWAVIGLLVVTLAWAGVVYFGKRTHGATASDPYAYAQMGVDLAERGTFLHRFSLFQTVIPLGIAWAPLQPVGYHIPRNDLGDCPSVWATGASVLLAAGYRLLGETGLYVTTPIVALLALAATWALVQETLRGESAAVRHLTAALTVTLLATSPEHVDRLLVPMADAAAQLFTVLTLWFLLRGVRKSGKWGWVDWGLAGLCLGWAYWVRHTQLVLFVPAFLALSQSTNSQFTNSQSTNLPISRLVVLLGAAAIAAAPDIAYRWRVFGGPLATETTELHLMSLRHIGPVAWQMLREALVAGEWGYLFPLVLYGAYRLARERRREAAILGSAFAAVLLVHLTYRSLRLRDLISLFPLVDLAAAYGAVALVRRVRRITQGREARLGAALLPAATLAWVILSLALSRWAMIDNLWKPGWASFGYMRAEQRAAFDRLAELTPPEAVIGASLNAGAVMMYTGRDAVRPYDSWTEEEWGIFLAAMEAEGR